MLTWIGSDVQTLAKHSPVPVINALCDLYHPTQILADLLTLYETYSPPLDKLEIRDKLHSSTYEHIQANVDPLACLQGKKIAWVGDTNNIINEIMVTMPRLGMEVSVASPKGYDVVDERVWQRV